MTDRPDLEEAYMQDAIATAKQFGAVVKDVPAAKTPSFIVQGEDAAIEEHIAQGVKRGTITDATKPAVGDGKFTSRADIAGPKGAGREIG